MNLDEAITKVEESLLKAQAEIGHLQELLEQARKRRDTESAALQALQFAKQAVEKSAVEDTNGDLP